MKRYNKAALKLMQMVIEGDRRFCDRIIEVYKDEKGNTVYEKIYIDDIIDSTINYKAIEVGKTEFCDCNLCVLYRVNDKLKVPPVYIDDNFPDEKFEGKYKILLKDYEPTSEHKKSIVDVYGMISLYHELERIRNMEKDLRLLKRNAKRERKKLVKISDNHMNGVIIQ